MTASKRSDNAHIHSMSLNPAAVKKIDGYAERHGMSRSEALGIIADLYVEDSGLKARPRVTQRVTFWMAPEKYKRFMAKVRRRGTTVSGAVESVLEEHL